MTAFLWIAMVAGFGVSILAGTGTIPSYGNFPIAFAAAAVAVTALACLLYSGRQSVLEMRAADRAARGEEPEEEAAPSAPAPLPAHVVERQAEVAQNTAVLQQAIAEPAPGIVRIDGHDGHYLEVGVTRDDATQPGRVTVQVTAFNYSGSKFEAVVFSKLTRIKQVTWLKPVNLGKGENDRRRQMTGTTSPADLSSVMAAIATIK